MPMKKREIQKNEKMQVSILYLFNNYIYSMQIFKNKEIEIINFFFLGFF